MSTAVYPGRFDPVTNGHVDIAMRAAGLFDRIIVAVVHLAGGALFSTEERVEFFRQAVAGSKNIAVKAYSGLTVEFAKEEGADVLVRGIRAVTGFEAEFDMALMNKRMAPGIESVYLMASLDHLFISGSRIREVAPLGYDVTDLVPDHVARALNSKFRNGPS